MALYIQVVSFIFLAPRLLLPWPARFLEYSLPYLLFPSYTTYLGRNARLDFHQVLSSFSFEFVIQKQIQGLQKM
jgi:hypothetical protein